MEEIENFLSIDSYKMEIMLEEEEEEKSYKCKYIIGYNCLHISS
jgi:hypothetical protein